jgi:hypothetical protein
MKLGSRNYKEAARIEIGMTRMKNFESCTFDAQAIITFRQAITCTRFAGTFVRKSAVIGL